MSRAKHSPRKALRAVIEDALAREAGLAEDARRRVVNRILRQSHRIAEIGAALRAAEAAAPMPVVRLSEASQHQTHAAPVQVFDPYAIGVVVTLQRHGADALLDRLSAISSVEHLVSLAAAQNLALEAGWSNADELRAAIVCSAEQRLADRRAAAS